MNWTEFFDFLKYSITIIAIVVIVFMILNSGFMLKTFKLHYKDFINIEVSGTEAFKANVSRRKVSEKEKNTQPDQK